MDMSAFKGQTAGVDVNGNPVKLGEFDSMGHIVGYIDDEGNCYESIRERDCCVSAGRFHDQVVAFRRGEREDMPDPTAVAKANCMEEANVPHAVSEIKEEHEFMEALRPPSGDPLKQAERIINSMPMDTLIQFATVLALFIRAQDEGKNE